MWSQRKFQLRQKEECPGSDAQVAWLASLFFMQHPVTDKVALEMAGLSTANSSSEVTSLSVEHATKGQNHVYGLP